MPTWQIEMLWDCTHCKRKGNRGRFKNCEGCGQPFEGTEEDWYAPADTSIEAKVTDSEQLRHAQAGPDWSCQFCGGNQRDLDGNCQNCGGAKVDEFKPVSPEPERSSIEANDASSDDFDEWHPSRFNFSRRNITIAAIVAGSVLAISLLFYFLFRTVELEVTVRSVSWQHIVHVDRYMVVHEEGFDEDRPSGGFNVDSHGRRHHHYVQVFDHMETEHYTEQVACGQDCYTTPKSCSSNSNGYMTCTGGDRVCSTKYCNESRTRQRKVYRDESVTETWYSWDVWKWVPVRHPTVFGDNIETYWPTEDQIGLNRNIGRGEQERQRKEANYKVVFTTGEDDYDFEPKSLEQFRQFPVGSDHKVLYSIIGGVKLPEEDQSKNNE